MHILSQTDWFIILIATFVIGMGKAGLRGVDMLNVTLMAMVFGAKTSTGIVLPLLCIADIAAVSYYHRHAQWKHFWKVTPWMALGVLLGVYLGKDMNEMLFRKLMAIIILVSIVIVLIMEYKKSATVPDHPLFAASTGISAGFTTMIGNLAGTFSNLYFLAMRLTKNDFIGTGAWIFLIMNLFKLPFQIFYWKNITLESVKVDALLVPALAAGFFVGIKVVGRIKDEQFRKLVIVLTIAGAFLMLLRR
jgi:hypothetical protein